jgi:alpha/beta superfamily hydrolase
MGGSRSDSRLTAVADGIIDGGIACLRFDYGSWDEGRGELRDATAALDWARERYDAVACFGSSFGGCLALAAAADASERSAVSALAPAARVGDALDAVLAVERIDCPGQVVYGERDDTVEWQPVVERARDRGFSVTGVAADHHFVGQTERVASLVVSFLSDHLGPACLD